jgi:hypothetical protein
MDVSVRVQMLLIEICAGMRKLAATVPVRATSHYTKRATPTKISSRKTEAVEPHTNCIIVRSSSIVLYRALRIFCII